MPRDLFGGGWGYLADICSKTHKARPTRQRQNQGFWRPLTPWDTVQQTSATSSWYTQTSADLWNDHVNQLRTQITEAYRVPQTIQLALAPTYTWSDSQTVQPAGIYPTLCDSYYNRQAMLNQWYEYNTQQWIPTFTYATGSGSGFNLEPMSINPLTEEQKTEHRRQARLDDLAAQRAKALLLEHLSDEQRVEYEENKYFHVIGQGGRLYRIKYGSAGNVYRIGIDGKTEAKFCIHARDNVPHEDNMLAQMLLLQFDEEQFLATANRHY